MLKVVQIYEIENQQLTKCSQWYVFILQPTPTPKRPNEEDSDGSEDETSKPSKTRRMALRNERTSQVKGKSLPKEPMITDKEREDILRFVETETTEVFIV